METLPDENVVTMKRCYKCNLEKPKTLEHFYKSGLYTSVDNPVLSKYCKTCDDLRRKRNSPSTEAKKAWYHRNKEKLKEKRQQKKIESEQVAE